MVGQDRASCTGEIQMEADSRSLMFPRESLYYYYDH